MVYDQIVFIGYVIDTAPKLGPGGSQTYLGLEDPKQDIAARCQLMLQAMELARTMIPAPSSPPAAVLYVFVAPEFFFRGATGAYEMDDVDLAIATLQDIAKQGEWQDWVFEFGTIVAALTSPEPGEPGLICNFALVQEGGTTAAGPSGARIVAKELMSDIDFIAESANPASLVVGAVEHLPSGRPATGAERQIVAYDGAGIFSMVGLTWAVEICLDHLDGRLQRSPQFPGEPLIQVELIPSCGADITLDNVTAMPGGYVLNVDGMEHTAHADLRQVAMPLDSMTPIQPISYQGLNCDTVTLPDTTPPVTVQVSDLYANGPGHIVVYGAVPVPPASDVPGSTSIFSSPVGKAKTWTFTFYLLYDDQGDFTQALVKIQSKKINFYGNKYFIPLYMPLIFPPEPPSVTVTPGMIDISLIPGGNGYNHAIKASINVPDFSFQGIVLQFMTAKDSLVPVQFCWQNP
jgi:hypothetical protein